MTKPIFFKHHIPYPQPSPTLARHRGAGGLLQELGMQPSAGAVAAVARPAVVTFPPPADELPRNEAAVDAGLAREAVPWYMALRSRAGAILIIP